MKPDPSAIRLLPVLLLNVTAFAVAIPVLPALAAALGGDALDVGLLYALQSAGQFAASPLWGRLSDRHGRKPILLATFAAAVVLEALTALTQSLWMLYAARLAVGLAAGSITAATALLADRSDAANRSRAMGVVGMSFGIGFTIGPALGAVASLVAKAGAGPLGLGLPFLLSALLHLANLALCLWLVREPRHSAEDRHHNRTIHRQAPLLETLRQPALTSTLGAFLVYSVAVAVMEGSFVVYMSRVHGLQTAQIGFFFAGMGVLMALAQGAVGRVSQLLGDGRMATLGLLILALGFGAASLGSSMPVFAASLGVATLGRAFAHPGMLASASRLGTEQGRTGQVMGLVQSASSLGRILGPPLGGLLLDAVSSAAPFLLAAILAVCAAAWWWHRVARPVDGQH